MHTGLLWFDNDPHTTLSVKIQKAIEHYRKKFGRLPDLCLVPADMLASGQSSLQLEKLTVRSFKYLMPGHIWIGVEEQS